MKTIDIRTVKIKICRVSPSPVTTAAHHLADWLRQRTGISIGICEFIEPEQEGFQIVIGTLDQPGVRKLAESFNLPINIRYDGYVVALRDEMLLIYSQVPRGVIYACGYEIPRLTTVNGLKLVLDLDVVVEEPDDDVRGWLSYLTNDHLPNAAIDYRFNLISFSCLASKEVLLAHDLAMQPYIAQQKPEILQRRQKTDDLIAQAKSYGLDVILYADFWHLPTHLYEGLTNIYPETIATSYRPGSEWPPYEWQDRPMICFSNPTTKQFYTSVVDEFMSAHPEADGLAMDAGYDGYPLACGCFECCKRSYSEQIREQVMLVYDVVVNKHHKKLLFSPWVTGGSFGIPGYDYFYDWVKDFADANSESIIISHYPIEGDFNLTHRLAPYVGKRGTHDMPWILIWPEYRGDGFALWLMLDWMENNLPALRVQGARGFFGVDCVSLKERERDILQGALEIYALGEMTWKRGKTAKQVAADYCNKKFGNKAGPIIKAALLKSSDVGRNIFYLPSGIRFSAHSSLDPDLRVVWDINTVYDSATYFLSEEQRQKITKEGAPFLPKIEADLPCLAFTEQNVNDIIHAKDKAVSDAEWMVAQAELAREYLEPEMYEQIQTRFEWLLNYARFYRGFARAFFHIRMARQIDGEQVIAGADEMAAAFSVLPQTGEPFPYELPNPYFGGYPWTRIPLAPLIRDIRAVGELLTNGISEHPIGLMGSEDVADKLNSIYVPYERCLDLEDHHLARFSVIVIGPVFMRELRVYGEKVADYIQNGGKVLLYNQTENYEAMPTEWLPGKVESFMCNHPRVQVSLPKHPIVQDFNELRPEPITRFENASSQDVEAKKHAPCIKTFLAVSNEWRSLTFPEVLAETTWGKGRILIDLIPDNRTILLRSLVYLTRSGG